MGLKYYKHKQSGELKRSLKPLDPQFWEEQIVAPNQKFMITANKATGTSKLKDSDKILRERARNFARDVEIDRNIQINKANGLDRQVAQGLLNNKGQRRRKIDDV